MDDERWVPKTNKEGRENAILSNQHCTLLIWLQTNKTTPWIAVQLNQGEKKKTSSPGYSLPFFCSTKIHILIEARKHVSELWMINSNDLINSLWFIIHWDWSLHPRDHQAQAILTVTKQRALKFIKSTSSKMLMQYCI